MPTSTFDRKIEITDEKSIRKLLLLLADVTQAKLSLVSRIQNQSGKEVKNY